MVELDFTTATTRGLSRSAREAVRRTGRLPEGLVHPAVDQAWAAVNAGKAFEVKSATVADIQRSRDEGWQVGQTSGWGAFGEGAHPATMAPPPSGPSSAVYEAPGVAGWFNGCDPIKQAVWDARKECIKNSHAADPAMDGGWKVVMKWCYKNVKSPHHTGNYFEDMAADAIYSSTHCDCENVPWLIDDPSTWPTDVLAEFGMICDWWATQLGASCGVMHWDALDFGKLDSNAISGADAGGAWKISGCYFGWDDPSMGGPCEYVLPSTPLEVALKCRETDDGKAYGVVPVGSGPFGDWVDAQHCGCWKTTDFDGQECLCDCTSVSCHWYDDQCHCDGTCDESTKECSGLWGSFHTVRSDCSGV